MFDRLLLAQDSCGCFMGVAQLLRHRGHSELCLVDLVIVEMCKFLFGMPCSHARVSKLLRARGCLFECNPKRAPRKKSCDA